MSEAAPFFYYGSKFIEVLHQQRITLVFSTYQAGKLIFVSSPDGEVLHKYGKTFRRPMGIDTDGDQLAVASRNFVEIYSNSRKLAKAYPEKPNYFDAYYTPQVKYYTGITDMHEVAFRNGELWAVNTAFSCISKMSDSRHFLPVWQPNFITALEPEDRCHLNGLILDEEGLAYVTMFDHSDTDNGWRNTPIDTGMLYDCRAQQPVLENLSMPHSPTLHEGSIFFLQSALGKVMRYDLASGELNCVIELNSFVRGLDVHGDYLFVGSSKMRESSKSFTDLPVSEKSFPGVVIVNYKTGERIGGLNYTDHIQEIFEVRVLQDTVQPFMLTERDEGYEMCINCGDDLNYWLVQDQPD